MRRRSSLRLGLDALGIGVLCLLAASSAGAHWTAVVDVSRLQTRESSEEPVSVDGELRRGSGPGGSGAVHLLETSDELPCQVRDGWTLNGREPVILTSGDFFHEIGDYYRSWCNTSNVSVGSALGSSGGPQTWDFTTGPVSEVKRFDYVVPSDGDNPGVGFYAAAQFPDADFSQRMTVESGGDQAWMYLDQDESVGRTNYGFYWPDAYSQTDDWSVFEPPILDFPDPLSYMDQWLVSTTYYFQMYDTGSVFDVRVDLVVDSEADAWGTAVLPELGPVECLRINGQQTSTIYVWLGDWVHAGTQYVRTYYWIGVGSDVMVEIGSPVSDSSMPAPDFAMAANFLRQFENSNPTAVPEIAEIPDQILLETYAAFACSVEAAGTPSPTFSLTEAPGDMTIDETTGLIEWTPTSADVGRDTVTVLAENPGGTDTETFVITVLNLNEPPEAVATGLFNSGPTELTWDPPASTHWLSGYSVHHSADTGGPYDLLLQVGPSDTSVVLDAPAFSEPNYYVVTAELDVDSETYESVVSNEVVAYSLVPWEEALANDDGSAESGHQAGGATGEMAAKLELTSAEEAKLTKVAVYLAELVDAPLTVKVSADDSGGYPGSSLAQAQYPLSMLRQGWNILEIPEFMQPSFTGGGFFVGVVEGATGSTVGLDEGSYGHSFTKAPGGSWSFMFSGELMFRAVILGDQTGVQDSIGGGQLSLVGSYPNPTNSGATIAFRVPERCRASVTVFNSSGQEIACLLEGTIDAGPQTIHWNGQGVGGRPVASGIYFYELKAADEVKRGRLLVLR